MFNLRLLDHAIRAGCSARKREVKQLAQLMDLVDAVDFVDLEDREVMSEGAVHLGRQRQKIMLFWP